MEHNMRAKYELRSVIKKAKSNHAAKLKQHIASNDTRAIWNQLKIMVKYKKPQVPNLRLIPTFLTDSVKSIGDSNNAVLAPPPPPLYIQEDEVRDTFG